MARKTNSLPCFLCGSDIQKRIDKNGKPYFICNPCGIQLFVRRQHGIQLLDKLLRTQPNRKPRSTRQANQIPKMQLFPLEIDGAKAQINRLRLKLQALSEELEQLARSRSAS